MAIGVALVIEPKVDALTILRLLLEEEDLEVLDERSGEAGLVTANRERPSLILVEPSLPDMDGLEVCRFLRSNSRTASIPILVVTDRPSPADQILALDAGADGFMRKPVEPNLFRAQVRALLRRDMTNAPPTEIIQRGNLKIDLLRHLVMSEDREVHLTATEFRIIYLLALRYGKLVSRSELAGVANCRKDADACSLDVHINRIRKKLGIDPFRIVRGFGYKLVAVGEMQSPEIEFALPPTHGDVDVSKAV